MTKKTDFLNKIGFSDLFVLEDIQHLQDLFSDSMGVASIITDVNGIPITNPSNFSRLCNEIIRKTEIGCANCFKSDSEIGKQNSTGPIVMKCLSGGLWDAGASISVGGKHIANWLIGQIRNEDMNKDLLIQYANEIGADEDDFKLALDEVNVMSVEQFNKVAKLLFVFANEISEKAYNNLLLKWQISEKEKTDQLLKEYQDRFAKVFHDAPVLISISDINDGTYLDVNEHALKVSGFSRNEVIGHTAAELGWLKPEDRAALSLQISRIGHVIDLEMTFHTKEGKLLYGLVNGEKLNIGGRECLLTVTIDITDRKLAEDNFKKSQEKLSIVFNTMEEGVALNEFVRNEYGEIVDYRILEVNSAFERITMLSRELAVGQVATLIYGMTPEYINNFWKQHIYDKQSVKTEFYHEQTNKWFQVSISQPVEDKFVSLFFDITDLKQSEKQIRLLSKAIEQSPVSVVITDKEGYIKYANPKFSELTGYTLDEVIDKNPRILQSGLQSKEFYTEFWNTILSGKDWHGEFHNKKKNGDLYWESAVVSSILDNQEEISFFVAVKEDVTEMKKMVQDLIISKEKAEESDRLKTAFLANVSHEIRTPMNGILGFAELLKEPELTGEKQQEYISIIEKSGARMLNIINDIIDISKIESGQIDINYVETCINLQMEFVYKFFKPEAEKKGINFTLVNSLPFKDSFINTDTEKIYAILTNLVKNALKFTKTGSIEFGYNLKSDFRSDEKEFQVLEFFVKDSGVGIPENQIEIIFERFRQGSEQLSRNYEGAGLGLFISKSYVEMLGGKIWVESQLDLGSTFYFTIPYEKNSI